MDSADYRHQCDIQVRFNDIDKIGHVNNAVYHSYLELGRVHYLNDVMEGTINWDEEGFVLARTEIDYLRPLYLRDQISCFTRFESAGNKSFILKSSICRKTKDGWETCSTALTTLVCMDYTSGKSKILPQAWLEKMETFEKK